MKYGWVRMDTEPNNQVCCSTPSGRKIWVNVVTESATINPFGKDVRAECLGPVDKYLYSSKPAELPVFDKEFGVIRLQGGKPPIKFPVNLERLSKLILEIPEK